MKHIIPFGYILGHPSDFPWNFAVYLPRNSDWSLQTSAEVLDPNDCSDDQEDPPLATANSLRYALSVHDIQSIVENAQQQLPSADLGDLLRAFNYDLRHDAFIQFN